MRPVHFSFAVMLLSSFFLLIHCFQVSAPGEPDCRKAKIPSDMKCIPGGNFIRGSDKPSVNEDTQKIIHDETPQMNVYVSAFFMDETEVTYSQYQECYKKGACSKAGPNYRGYDGPNMPMLGLSWFQARDFCLWKSKRLPTEAEWEKAARGDRGDLFPWGNQPANCKNSIIKEKEKGCGTGKTWDVKSRPSGRYGLYDMAGNSWEWVNDWYSENYAACGESCTGENPKGPCQGAERCPGHKEKIVKGGSWWWSSEFARGSNRRPHYPQNKPYHHFGFRCAKDIKND
ncbi:MAG: formylglycine-generating enzyme family protein [Spirochaetia bacterium]|nr:formylglycine-generating enzyme family protein [Spirochaetia bacterium]